MDTWNVHIETTAARALRTFIPFGKVNA